MPGNPEFGAVMDVVVWLRGLGLGRYEAAFRENEIDETVLPSLTHETLKELGVTAVGHRLKLLDAIADLRDDESAQTRSGTAAPARLSAATPTSAPVAEAVGERRHVTVMFCDLVGSTSISAGLDAEDWRDLVGSYLDAASAAVTEMGGHVAKKLGDGLMALFGYPVAQENDAERAARAALSIQRSLAEINRKNAGSGKPALSARIGIETGPVVVDASGEIYGDAPNTAARVQALAEPSTVVVTAQVQRQIAGLFVAEERGSHPLKGVPEPVTLFQLVRASGGGRRAGQRHLTPLVGREEEIAMLMRRWERARQGDGQLVLIVGEPGLGKSRLIEEFHTRLGQTPHTWVEWGCSQLLQNTPLHPIAEWGRQQFGGTETAAEQQLADLENTLALIKLDPAENVPLLAPLLEIPLPKERASTLAPEELRRRQLLALTNLVMAGARAQPVVLALEDLQWADPTTLDVLRGIAERGALAPLFVLMTARPEFRPSWGARSHHGTISLAPLDRYQVVHMVGELAARHALAKEVIEGVTERTGGVPLFVEEVTRLLLERGEQGGIQAIPPTLQQSLTARLDRLGSAREVAQIGAVIGRDFSYGLLRAVAGMEDTPLQMALERLAAADILLVQGLPPDADYRFKHALIQDAAYENLLRSRRQVLHRRIGEVLRDQFAARAAAEPELLAHHFTQAALPEAAIEWWGKAGQRSLERSAMMEAMVQLDKGLELLKAIPDANAVRQQEIKFLTTRAVALRIAKGYGSDELLATLVRARELCQTHGDPRQMFQILFGIWTATVGRADWLSGKRLAEECLAIAQNETDSAMLIEAHRLLGSTAVYMAEHHTAERHLSDALQLYEPEKHRANVLRYGYDPGTTCNGYISWALWLEGKIVEALAASAASRRLAIESEHAPSLALAYGWSAVLHLCTHDLKALGDVTSKLVGHCEEFGFPHWLALGKIGRGWFWARTGRVDDGLESLQVGIEEFRSLWGGFLVSAWLVCLADILRLKGRFTEARAALDDSLRMIERSNERIWKAENHRVCGEVARDAGEFSEAAAAFELAIHTAREQSARCLELRAATSLARLWRDQGKIAEARDLVAPVYNWFTERLDTPVLEEARKLLQSIP